MKMPPTEVFSVHISESLKNDIEWAQKVIRVVRKLRAA